MKKKPSKETVYLIAFLVVGLSQYTIKYLKGINTFFITVTCLQELGSVL